MKDTLIFTIQKREYAWRFNFYALLELAELLNADPLKSVAELIDLSVIDKTKAFTYLLYAGMLGFQYETGTTTVINLATAAGIVAKTPINEFDQLINAFNFSQNSSSFLKSVSKEENDKKALNFTELYEYAIEEIGLKPNDFLKLTWYQYTLMLAAHIKRTAREWEHTRFIAYWVYLVNSGDDRETILQFMPLLTDPPAEVIEPLTDEQRTDIMIEAQKRAQILRLNRDE